MNEYADLIKKNLETMLSDMDTNSHLFSKHPEKDFTRKRKLDLKEMLRILLSMGGNSLRLELMEYFSYDLDTATTAAFVQQREKILPKAFEFLFHKFTKASIQPHFHESYRLLAVDGSGLCISYNPNDIENHFPNGPIARGFNLLHLNAMYDLCSRVYVDALVQPGRHVNEGQAMIDMVERSDIKDKTIVIADRNYENYNSFEHIQQKGWNYVVRIKDINSNGISSRLIIPEEDTFDKEYNLLLTRRQTKEIKANPEKYKIMPKHQKFDYLPPDDKGTYPMYFRIVRFPITGNQFEVLITNLSEIEFPINKLKELYDMRWGVETSFRELKYAIGLSNFHSKKVAYVTQEIFARLTMYNFCEIITMNVVIQQKDRKHIYQVNFTIAIAICLQYFKWKGNISPPNVEALIQKNILPIRHDRTDPRKVRTRSSVSFLYRIA